MSVARDRLREQFTELLDWERRKRFEQTALGAAGIGVALAIVLLPLSGYLPVGALRWFMPLLLMLLVAPWLFHRWRWRQKDATRTLVKLDQSLNLAERATTAWELADQGTDRAVDELVFKQAREQLAGLAPQRLFPRQWAWQSYAVAPLLALWLALLWFEVDRSLVSTNFVVSPTLAFKVGEFSRELQEKAKSEGLRESLKAGRELEKLVRKNLEEKSDESQLKQELASMANKFATAAQSGAEKESFAAGESQQALQDLKTELAVARDLLSLPEAAQGDQTLPRQWMDRLESMPQLKRQLDKGAQSGPGVGPNEMKSFLDQLEQQATGELDRRTLIDAQRYLEQMTQPGQGRRDHEDLATARAGDQDGAGDDGKEKSRGSLPGKEPGKKDDLVRGLPEFRGGAQTEVKGMLGDGDSRAVGFKGRPKPGTSVVSSRELPALYRRQAEQALNSERVPAALKETIKNYFLSLENNRLKSEVPEQSK